MQGHTCLAFAFSYSLKYALSNYVSSRWYLDDMTQVNFRGSNFASGRGNAGAHMSGIYIFGNVMTSLVI